MDSFQSNQAMSNAGAVGDGPRPRSFCGLGPRCFRASFGRAGFICTAQTGRGLFLCLGLFRACGFTCIAQTGMTGACVLRADRDNQTDDSPAPAWVGVPGCYLIDSRTAAIARCAFAALRRKWAVATSSSVTGLAAASGSACICL